MKRITLFIIMLLSAAAPAQDLPKIAVYVTGAKTAGENKVLGAFMLEALIKSGKYTAVERSDDFVAQIDREQVMQHSGAVDERQIRQAGMRAGVQFVCVVDLSQAFGSSLISARIIDVVTAQVVSTSSMESALSSMGEIRGVAGQVVGNMLGMRITRGTAAQADSAAVAAAEERSRIAVAAAEESARAAKAEADELERARAAAAEEAERERQKAAVASQTAEQERQRASAAEAKAQKATKELAEEKRRAAEKSRNAAGLRLGYGNAAAADVFLKQNMGAGSRLDFAVGYREYNYDFVYATAGNGAEDIDYKYYQGVELFAAYSRRDNGELFSLYAGPGLAVFGYETRYYDEGFDVPDFAVHKEMGVSIGIGGHAGVEFYMGKMLCVVDVRPVFYIPLLNSGVDYISELRFTAGIGIGYRF
ncbi:MAG: hypothetical protein FWB85_12100 [Chitinispirillia bacterium]|nr:hypothetical protein [Chitinispirillia bacterium]MCL2242815.1 hypothetical protein [Chitinispirillia bacterium]